MLFDQLLDSLRIKPHGLGDFHQIGAGFFVFLFVRRGQRLALQKRGHALFLKLGQLNLRVGNLGEFFDILRQQFGFHGREGNSRLVALALAVRLSGDRIFFLHLVRLFRIGSGPGGQ